MSTKKPRISAGGPTLWPLPLEYRWIDGPHPKHKNRQTRWLVASAGVSPDYRYARHDPTIPEVFLEFAFLEHSEEAVRDFVDRYGDLGVRRPWPVAGRGPIHSGELFLEWISEIRAMRAAVELAAAIGDRRTGRLREWISFGENDSVRLVRSEPEARGTWAVSSELRRHLGMNEWKKAGRIILADMVNVRLKNGSATELTFDARSQELAVQFSSTSLRTAMWLQFGESVSLGRIVSCKSKSCRRPMRLLPGVRRSDTKTCSLACRVSYSRQLAKERAKTKKKRRTPHETKSKR